MAKARGGKLLSIDSAEEAKFIGQNLFGTLGEYDSDESVAEVQGDSAKAAQQDVLNGQLAKNGAWLGNDSTAGAVNNADAIIRNGNGKDLPKGYKAYDFSGDKLSRFVIEIENYKAPMTLNGKPVVDGQIIEKADFDKLVWNSDHNMGGKITYVAVQSGEANAAKVDGAEEKTMAVTESAAVTHPTAPATAPATNPQQGGAGTPEAQNNNGQAGGSKPQEGGSDSKAGGTTQNAGSQSQGQTPPSKPAGSDTQPGSAGGQSSDAPSKPAGTPEGQTSGTPLQSGGQADSPAPVKAAPSYEPNKSVSVAHDATDAKIAKEVFEGTNSANKPEAVKATGFAAGALKVDGNVITDGTLIKAADFDKVTWDASKGEGGSFKFTPVQANGDALQGATEQTITINEASAPVQAKPAPTYDANKTVDVAHDATDAKIAKEVFEGTNPANKPEAVKATGFAAGTLKVNGVAINPGDKIAAENFDKVTWDASKGEGGTFKFTPVQANGDALAQGGAEQTITINEASAPAPKKVAYVGHDVTKADIASQVFQDSEGSSPAAVKISGLTPDTLKKGGVSVAEGDLITSRDFEKLTWDSTKGDGGSFKFTPVQANGDAIEGATEKTVDVKEVAEPKTVEVGRDAAPLTLDKSIFGDADAVQILTVRGPVTEDRTDSNVLTYTPEGGQKTTLIDDSYLDKANFDKVQWDARADANNAGTYRILFKPVTAAHEEIPGAEPKEIKVHEATGELDYSTSPKTVHVENHDGTKMIPEAVFKGTGAPPLYVWIKDSTENEPTGSDRGFLKLEGGADSGKDVGHDAVISIGEMNKVQWDATYNNGGTIRFRPLDGDKKEIGEWQEIKVTEAPANEAQALGAADVLNPQGAGAQLKSLAAYTPAEPSSNLLDDLHNQISPLI